MGLTEKLSILIDAKTQGAEQAFSKVSKSADDMGKKAGVGGRALDKLGLSGKISGDMLKAGVVSGVGAAAAAITSFAAASIAHFADTAQEVRKFQRVTGQSAEDASHFVSAFDDMGISADVASSAMFKLSKNISGGGKSLTDLGIGIAHAADGTADLQGTFLNIADAVTKTSDPTERAAIVFAAFGKQGAALLPILEKGRKGIQELFKGADLNFTQAQLDSAEEYRLALDHLGDSVGKVQNRIGAALVPTLANAAEGLAVLIDKTASATDHNEGLKQGFDAVIAGSPLGPVRALVDGLGLLSDHSDDSKVSMEDAATASGYLGTSLESLAGKTGDEVQALVDQKKALDDVYTATLAQFDANFAYQDALNGTEDAAAKVAEAQAKLNEETKAHGVNSAEAKAASEELSRALLAQQEQALQTAEAAGRMAEENAKAGGATDATIPKIDAQIAELERQKAQMDARNVPAIQNMINQLNAIKAQYSTNINVNDHASPVLRDIQARIDRLIQGGSITIGGIGTGGGGVHWGGKQRASGGTVNPKEWSLVGEQGPELIRAGMGGATVLPNHALTAGGNTYVTVNAPNYVGTKEELARVVSDALKEHQRRGGQVPWAN